MKKAWTADHQRIPSHQAEVIYRQQIAHRTQYTETRFYNCYGKIISLFKLFIIEYQFKHDKISICRKVFTYKR
jgi:hypothetical protein